VGAAQDDPPVADAFLTPVERVDELAAAVEADVQLIRLAGAARARARAVRCGLCGALRRLWRAWVDIWALVGLHRRFTRSSSTCRREGFSPAIARPVVRAVAVSAHGRSARETDALARSQPAGH